MKKKQIQLGKKLFLNKETISTLNIAGQQGVAGGATGASDCLACNTQPQITRCGAGPCPSVFNCPTTPSAVPNCCVGPTFDCPSGR